MSQRDESRRHLPKPKGNYVGRSPATVHHLRNKWQPPRVNSGPWRMHYDSVREEAATYDLKNLNEFARERWTGWWETGRNVRLTLTSEAINAWSYTSTSHPAHAPIAWCLDTGGGNFSKHSDLGFRYYDHIVKTRVVVACTWSPNFGAQFSEFLKFWCFPLRPLQMLLPVRHWLKHMVVKFPAACRRTTLPMRPRTLARNYAKNNLTSQDLTSRPNTGGRGTISAHTLRFLNYAVTSQIQAANLTLTDYKPYIRGQPNVLAFASLVEWSSQRPLQSGKQRGDTWPPTVAVGAGKIGDRGPRRQIQVKSDEAAEDLNNDE
jgi:hypothetical protein